MIETSIDVERSMELLFEREKFTQVHKDIKIWKTLDDMARYRRVINETKPQLIIETGSRWGGFAAWLADTFDVWVITIDIQELGGLARTWPGVRPIRGSSVDPAVVMQVRQLAAGQRTMVTLDSDHHGDHVAEEIRAYGPMVTPSCYLVVEDGLADLVQPGYARIFGNQIPERGGPLAAIEQELVNNPDWYRDVDIEFMSRLSHHPAGWWVRR